MLPIEYEFYSQRVMAIEKLDRENGECEKSNMEVMEIILNLQEEL